MATTTASDVHDRLAAARSKIEAVSAVTAAEQQQSTHHHHGGSGPAATAAATGGGGSSATTMRRELLKGLAELDSVRRFLHDGINVSNKEYLDRGTKDAALHSALEQGLADLEQVRSKLMETLDTSQQQQHHTTATGGSRGDQRVPPPTASRPTRPLSAAPMRSGVSSQPQRANGSATGGGGSSVPLVGRPNLMGGTTTAAGGAGEGVEGGAASYMSHAQPQQQSQMFTRTASGTSMHPSAAAENNTAGGGATRPPPRPMSASAARPGATTGGGARTSGGPVPAPSAAAPNNLPYSTRMATGNTTGNSGAPPPTATGAAPSTATAAAAAAAGSGGAFRRPMSAPSRRAASENNANSSTLPTSGGAGSTNAAGDNGESQGGPTGQWARYQEWAQQVMSRMHTRRVSKHRQTLSSAAAAAAAAANATSTAGTTSAPPPPATPPSAATSTFAHSQSAPNFSATGGTGTASTGTPLDAAGRRPPRPMSATAAGGGIHGVRRVHSATNFGSTTSSTPLQRPSSARAGPGISNDAASGANVRLDATAQSLREQGNVLFQQKRYADAADAYGNAIHIEPHSEALYCNRAAAWLMLSRFTDALSDAQKAIDIDPTHVKAHWRAAKACLYLGHTDQARSFYAAAQRLSDVPADMECIAVETKATELVDRCRRCLRLREFSEAVKLAEQILDIFPPSGPCASPWQCLKAEAMLATDPSEALTYITTVNQSDPNSAEAWFLRAKAIFYTGHDAASTSSAISFATRARDLDNKHSRAPTLLSQVDAFAKLRDDGNNAYAAGRWHEAYTAYTKCLSVDPFNSSLKAIILCNRSAVCIQCERWKDALDDINQSISLNGHNAKAYTRRARIEQQQGNHDGAVRDLQTAAQLYPSSENQERLTQAIDLRNQQQAANARAQQRSGGSGNGENYGAGAGFRFFGFSGQPGATGGGATSGGPRRPQSASTGGPKPVPPPQANQGPSPYAILSVERFCDEKVLVKAYREAALKWHPDKWAAASDVEKTTAERTFKEVSAAYHLLRDPVKRRQFDLGQAVFP